MKGENDMVEESDAWKGGNIQHAVCEFCHFSFMVDTGELDWAEEPEDPKLGYRTWKADFFCVRCGEPTSIWKRSGKWDETAEPKDIIQELTSKTRVLESVSYVKTSDYAKACSIALELKRKLDNKVKENSEIKLSMAELEAENTRKTGEIIRLAHRPVEYMTGFIGGGNDDGKIPLPEKPGFVLNQKTCAIEPSPFTSMDEAFRNNPGGTTEPDHGGRASLAGEEPLQVVKNARWCPYRDWYVALLEMVRPFLPLVSTTGIEDRGFREEPERREHR